MGFVNNHFIKFHSCVHSAHVALISEKFRIKWTLDPERKRKVCSVKVRNKRNPIRYVASVLWQPKILESKKKIHFVESKINIVG